MPQNPFISPTYTYGPYGFPLLRFAYQVRSEVRQVRLTLHVRIPGVWTSPRRVRLPIFGHCTLFPETMSCRPSTRPFPIPELQAPNLEPEPPSPALQIWAFPKIGGVTLGVPINRSILFWDVCWGSPILGNYHLAVSVAAPLVLLGSLLFQDRRSRGWL